MFHFHIILTIASRLIYLGNALQRVTRGILALRNLGAISSRLIPAISPPPPIALLDAPLPIVALPDEIIPPYPSVGLIALQRIERQPPPFASPIPSYQSSLITVPSSRLPIFLPLFIIMLAIISGLVLLLPQIIDLFMNVAESRNIFKYKLSPHLRRLFSWAIGPIVTILQWCGLLAVQDTRTPPLLNAIYEQITRGAAGYDDLVDCGDITYDEGSLRYPDLAHDDIPEGYRLRLQSIYTQFVDTQNCFREQLDLSRAHQLELRADLLAAEHERERLVAKRQGAKARCAEAEVIVSKLRADLTAAMDNLDRQTEVASSKDEIIQSVTEKSQVANVRLKYAEDKITHLNAKLRHERDRRHHKTKELLDEQVKVQDRHESEIRRFKEDAQDAQEQLDTLRSAMSELHVDRQPPLDSDNPACYRQPTTQPCDTCHPSLPERHSTDNTGAPPISPATNVDSSLRSTKSPSISPGQDQEGSFTHQDPKSEVIQDHWAALKSLFRKMRQEEDENESVRDAVKPNSEQQESRLQDELAVTKEQLSLVEEEFSTALRDIDESRETLQEVKSHVVSLQFEWEICKEMLREAQDARRSSMTDLAQVIELLRVSQAEWEESQLRCSQVTFLSAALQERVVELEAEVKKLKKYPAITPVHTDSESRLTGTGTATSDAEAITHEDELKLQDSDSIYMTIPPLLPRLLDLSLPTRSSPFTSPGSLYLDDQECPPIPPARSDAYSHSFGPIDADVRSITCNTDSFLLELSLALQSCESNSSHHYEVGPGDVQDVHQSTELVRSAVDPGSANPEFTNLGHLLPPSSPSLEGVSRLRSPRYRTFLSERNSLGSMDWPPIGSVLFPGSGNVRQGREEDVFETEEGADDPIPCYQETPSPLQESEPVLERRDPKPPISSIITPDSPIPKSSHREQGIHSLQQDRCSVTNASPTPSGYRDAPIRPPHHSPPPPSNLLPPPPLELLDSVTIDSVSDGTVQLRKGRRRPSHRDRRGFSHMHDDIPVPKLDYDLPADFVPSFTRRTAPKQQAVDSDIDEFAFLIPLDCRTSTPAAAVRRTRTLEKTLLGSGGGEMDFLAGIINKFSPPSIFSPRRKRMPLRMIDNSPRPWVRPVRPNTRPQERNKLLDVKGKERMLVQEEIPHVI